MPILIIIVPDFPIPVASYIGWSSTSTWAKYTMHKVPFLNVQLMLGYITLGCSCLGPGSLELLRSSEAPWLYRPFGTLNGSSERKKNFLTSGSGSSSQRECRSPLGSGLKSCVLWCQNLQTSQYKPCLTDAYHTCSNHQPHPHAHAQYQRYVGTYFPCRLEITLYGVHYSSVNHLGWWSPYKITTQYSELQQQA